jgi:glutathione synthase/RimK-type ligase-like ATP-grasp enzyme
LKNKILLIGKAKDPHIKALYNNLKTLGQDTYVLDSLSKDDRLSIKMSSTIEDCFLLFKGKRIDFIDLKSIWNSQPIGIIPDKKLDKNSLDFTLSEWKEGLMSLTNMEHVRWVNDPYSIFNSFNRLKQLCLAQSFGLSTPKTLITNDVISFKSFFKDCNNNVIAKTLHSGKGVPSNKMIFSTKIDPIDIPNQIQDLKYTPCMFQEYILKKTEYRITLIDKIFHTVEICSQNSSKTAIDWRNLDDFTKTPYIKSELPEDIQEKLLRLCEKMNLRYCTIDMINTPSDEIVFLEVNSQGRWYWIQQLIGLDISVDIARYLAC